jgi:hypothetical protein
MHTVAPGSSQSVGLCTLVLHVHACGLMVPSGSVGWLQSVGTHTFSMHGVSHAGSRVVTVTLQKLSGSPSDACQIAQLSPLASTALSAASWPSYVSCP